MSDSEQAPTSSNDDTTHKTRKRQSIVPLLPNFLKLAKTSAQEEIDQAQEAHTRAQEVESVIRQQNSEVRKLIQDIPEFLEEEKADPNDIKDLANQVLPLSLPVGKSEIDALAGENRVPVDHLPNIDEILGETDGDLERANQLLADANQAKQAATAVASDAIAVVTASRAAGAAKTQAADDMQLAEDKINEHKVVGSSYEALTSSNDDISHPSIRGKIEVGGWWIFFHRNTLKQKEKITLTTCLPGRQQSDHFLVPLTLKCEGTPQHVLEPPVDVHIESIFPHNKSDSTQYEVQESDDGKTWKHMSVSCYSEGTTFKFKSKRASMWRIKLQKPGPTIKLISVFSKRSNDELIWKLCDDFTNIRKKLEKDSISMISVIVPSDKVLKLHIKQLDQKTLDMFPDEIPIEAKQLFDGYGFQQLISIDDATFRHEIEATLYSGDELVCTVRFRWKASKGNKDQTSDQHEGQLPNIKIKDCSLDGVVVGGSGVTISK